MAPGGTGSVVVFFQRSHMTQRHGHSRLVRNTVATGTTSPDSDRSSSMRNAAGRPGSTEFRAGRRARIQRSRSATVSGNLLVFASGNDVLGHRLIKDPVLDDGLFGQGFAGQSGFDGIKGGGAEQGIAFHGAIEFPR